MRVYEALKAFDDEWDDLPLPLKEAYQSMRALKLYMEHMERERAELELAAWKAGYPLYVTKDS
jgi:hypothetical protein